MLSAADTLFGNECSPLALSIIVAVFAMTGAALKVFRIWFLYNLAKSRLEKTGALALEPELSNLQIETDAAMTMKDMESWFLRHQRVIQDTYLTKALFGILLVVMAIVIPLFFALRPLGEVFVLFDTADHCFSVQLTGLLTICLYGELVSFVIF